MKGFIVQSHRPCRLKYSTIDIEHRISNIDPHLLIYIKQKLSLLHLTHHQVAGIASFPHAQPAPPLIYPRHQMAKSDQLSAHPSGADFTSPADNLNNLTDVESNPLPGNENNDSKEGEPTTLPVLAEAAAIPIGTIDPVYEAKARVLNHAVSSVYLARSRAQD